MEYLDIVCPYTGRLLGEQLPRQEAIAKKAWCRSTNVYVLNSRGEILCHQRSLKKERLPGGWSTHLGGHVSAGEDFETNAQKELHEEAGILVAPTSLIPWRTSRLPDARLWVRDFVTLYDGPAQSLRPQPGEVECFSWMGVADILARSKKEPGTWFAGTHDLATDYACLRAVLAAAQSTGALTSKQNLHVWQPLLPAVL